MLCTYAKKTQWVCCMGFLIWRIFSVALPGLCYSTQRLEHYYITQEPHGSCSSLVSISLRGKRIQANNHCSLNTPTTYSSGFHLRLCNRVFEFIVRANNPSSLNMPTTHSSGFYSCLCDWVSEFISILISTCCLAYTHFFLKIGSYYVAQGVLEFKILLPRSL